MSTAPQGSTPSFGDSWNERMRLIRLRRKKEAFRFSEEFRVVPRWLKVLCLVLYLVAVVIAILVATYLPDSRVSDLRDNPPLASLAAVGIVTGVGLFISAFLMMLGYVNRDAKRRGMNSLLWTLLVLVLSPGYVGIGFIIYFLIREPLPYPCPRCSQPVGPRFNFCPNCKCDLHPSCPNCKHEVAETDRYCPYCGHELTRSALPASLPQPQAAGPE